MRNERLIKLKRQIAPTLKKYGIKKAGLFGSYARGDNTKKSDIDILIEFNKSLITLVGLERELEAKLHKKVDLVTYGGLSPYIKKEILAQQIKLL